MKLKLSQLAFIALGFPTHTVELEPLINGREYGWADIVVNIGGVPVTGITAIKYGEEMEKENIYGAGRNPVSRGYGRVKSTTSITLLSGTVFALKSKAENGQLHRIAPFSITVSYQPDAGPMVVQCKMRLLSLREASSN